MKSTLTFSNIHNADVNPWLSAGLQGRFDLFETRGTPSVRLASVQ
jgi:hypothetical protein